MSARKWGTLIEWPEAMSEKAVNMTTQSAYQQQHGGSRPWEHCANEFAICSNARNSASEGQQKRCGFKHKGRDGGNKKKEAESVVSKSWRHKDNSKKSSRLELQDERSLLLVAHKYILLPSFTISAHYTFQTNHWKYWHSKLQTFSHVPTNPNKNSSVLLHTFKVLVISCLVEF